MKHFKSLVIPSAFCLLFYTKISAEELKQLTSYQTTITQGDRESSTGTPLKNPADIIRQDRANVHKYGNPDADQVDTFFITPQHRADIPAMLKRGSISPAIEKPIAGDGHLAILVNVFVSDSGTFSMAVSPQAHTAGKIYEPLPGSPERKAILNAMRAPVSEYTGSRAIFTGNLSVLGNWAKFDGHVDPEKGKAFKDEVAGETELDFLAILKKENGSWVCKSFGWSGDISATMEAREKFPECPESLLPDLSKPR